MKLKDLKPVLHSSIGDIQFVSLYDSKLNMEIQSCCSFEYALVNYGDREVSRLKPLDYKLVIIL